MILTANVDYCGDIVYEDGHWFELDSCPSCNGAKILKGDDNKEVTCPKCCGEGFLKYPID